MSNNHHEGDSSKFTLTAFFSFVIMFCFLVLMANCHGNYNPAGTTHHEAAATEHPAGAAHE
jgi:hypothetical protein